MALYEIFVRLIYNYQWSLRRSGMGIWAGMRMGISSRVGWRSRSIITSVFGIVVSIIIYVSAPPSVVIMLTISVIS